ncbi:MAG: hypothetical protein J6I85_05705 [Clostridia bacterium]|nr:hypothetical protein [Clostridia bacterium]
MGINYYIKSGPNYSLATKYDNNLAQNLKYYTKDYNYTVAFTISNSLDYYYKNQNNALVKVEDYFVRGKTYYNA